MLLRITHHKFEEFHIPYLTDVWTNQKKKMSYFVWPNGFSQRIDYRQLTPTQKNLYVWICEQITQLKHSSFTVDTRRIHTQSLARHSDFISLATKLEFIQVVRLDLEQSECPTGATKDIEEEKEEEAEHAFSNFRELDAKNQAELDKLVGRVRLVKEKAGD